MGGAAFRVKSNKVKEKMESMGKIKILEKDEARGTVSVRMHAYKSCIVARGGHVGIWVPSSQGTEVNMISFVNHGAHKREGS